MVNSKRLAPIKKLAQNQEQQSARNLGEAIELMKIESAKLEQLKTYRCEYLAGMEVKVKEGVTGATLQHYHQFLNKLEVAITQQKEVVSRCELQINNNKDQWKNDHGRHKAIGDAMSKMQSKESKIKQKKEAVRADELSTQAFIRRQNSGH